MFFFFFKQKTAYEMRISDWSSDVCSSDLCAEPDRRLARGPVGPDPGTDGGRRHLRTVVGILELVRHDQVDLRPAVPGRGGGVPLFRDAAYRLHGILALRPRMLGQIGRAHV